VQQIFIGDVQGCADELDALFARATEAFSDDFELWVVGDLVNRGPDNRRALERVRELVEAGRAQYVLGNHEIHLISSGLGLRDLEENDSIGDVLGAPDASEWVDWLRRRPLVVEGKIAGQAFAMVHASVGPGWSLSELVARGEAASERLSGDRELARAFLALDPGEDRVREDLARLTRGRAATDSEWSSQEPETPNGAWHRAWSARDPDYGIVYGHWARQGLHVADGLRGLDTGCVHHGRGQDGFLTAWLPDSQPRTAGGRPFDAPDARFWQIPAKRRYYYPSQDPSHDAARDVVQDPNRDPLRDSLDDRA
jgi:bis(5'-nucleosyl)-tetraphosphatase (symmetrical)